MRFNVLVAQENLEFQSSSDNSLEITTYWRILLTFVERNLLFIIPLAGDYLLR